MLSYVFFLTSFCSLARFIICAPPSGLDILASVASKQFYSLTYPAESLQLSADQEAVLTKLVKSEGFQQQLGALQYEATDEVNYLVLLFRLLEMIPENGVTEYCMIWSVACDFAKASGRLDKSDELFDYWNLSHSKIKALGIASVTCSNLPLFKLLVKSDLLDLNDAFVHGSLIGNAIVFVHGDAEAFKFSLGNGLDLSSSVTVTGKEMPTIEFLKQFADAEIVELSQQWLGLDQAEAVNKRPSKSSSSGAKRARSSADSVSLSSNGSPSDNVRQHKRKNRGQAMPDNRVQAEIDWSELRRFKPGAMSHLNKEHYIVHLRNRLSEEGPERMAAFVSEYPDFLRRQDFLQMVREVLKGDLAMIATVYGGNIGTTARLLPELKKQFGNDKLFTDFLRELLKYCSDRVDVIACYTEMVASESAEYFANQDYSGLPVSILVEMLYHAVQNDAFALVDKLFCFNRADFDRLILTDANRLKKLFSGVQSAAMLKRLLRLGVPPIQLLEKDHPFVFHFLMKHDNQEFVAAIKESKVITKALVLESFRYCLAKFPGHPVNQLLFHILQEK